MLKSIKIGKRNNNDTTIVTVGSTVPVEKTKERNRQNRSQVNRRWRQNQHRKHNALQHLPNRQQLKRLAVNLSTKRKRSTEKGNLTASEEPLNKRRDCASDSVPARRPLFPRFSATADPNPGRFSFVSGIRQCCTAMKRPTEQNTEPSSSPLLMGLSYGNMSSVLCQHLTYDRAVNTGQCGGKITDWFFYKCCWGCIVTWIPGSMSLNGHRRICSNNPKLEIT